MDDDTIDDDVGFVRAARNALARRDWTAARRDFLAAKAEEALRSDGTHWRKRIGG